MVDIRYISFCNIINLMLKEILLKKKDQYWMNKYIQYLFIKSFKVVLSCVVFKNYLLLYMDQIIIFCCKMIKKFLCLCMRKKSKLFFFIYNDFVCFMNDFLCDKNYFI